MFHPIVTVSDYVHITLSGEEQDLARQIGRQRFNNNRRHGISDAKIGDQNEEWDDVNGFGGEIAFCKFMGLEPDIAIVAGGGDDLADAILGDGRRVDVKTTKYPNGNLVARKVQEDIELFVLVRGILPNYKIVGYAERAALLAAPKKELRYGQPTYFLSASKLRPIEELRP